MNNIMQLLVLLGWAIGIKVILMKVKVRVVRAKGNWWILKRYKFMGMGRI